MERANSQASSFGGTNFFNLHTLFRTICLAGKRPYSRTWDVIEMKAICMCSNFILHIITRHCSCDLATIITEVGVEYYYTLYKTLMIFSRLLLPTKTFQAGQKIRVQLTGSSLGFHSAQQLEKNLLVLSS